jgi:hypothetical protein
VLASSVLADIANTGKEDVFTVATSPAAAILSGATRGYSFRCNKMNDSGVL